MGWMILQVMDARLRELALLLPDVQEKLPVMQVKALAHMAADTQALADKLLALRKIFPSADISRVTPALIPIAVLDHFAAGQRPVPTKLIAVRQMVVRQPQIVLEHPIADIEGSAERLKTMLPGLDVDRYLKSAQSCACHHAPACICLKMVEHSLRMHVDGKWHSVCHANACC